VSKVTPAGVVSTFASGFSAPTGEAFDAAGNLYVANFGANTVSKVTPAGAVSPFASGFNEPEGEAFDAAGNLYVANEGNGTVSKVTPAGVVSTFASGFNFPTGEAFDAAGNLYVANNGNNAVSKVTPAGVVSTFASGFSVPVGEAFDAAGNLYVANFSANTVSKVSNVTVPFTLGGTAVSGTDYSGVTASPLVFPIGQTTEDISGTLLPDPGTIKTITFTLGAPTDATLGSPAANVLTIDDPNPTPTLTSISPASATVGDNETNITLTGTNFVNGSTAEFNGTPIQTFFNSATQLTAVIPGTDLTTVGADSITVATAGPGGGPSAPQTFTITNSTPPPVSTATITSLSTSSGFENSTFTVVINGSGFAPGATVTFGAVTLTPDSITPTQVTFTVPAAVSLAADESDAALGPVNIAVVNPGQAPSNAATFTVQEELLPDGTRGTANQRFLSEVYRDLFHRAIDQTGLASWGSQLDAGVSRISIVLAIEQDPGHEFLQVEVKDAYLQYLHRALNPSDPGDLAGLNSSVAYLVNGHSVEQLDAIIVSSQEYQSKAVARGGFNMAFYEDALGRPLGAPNDPPASPPLTPDQITAVFASPEFHTDLVIAYYRRFLDRAFAPSDPPAPTRFAMGTPDGVQIADILGDPLMEFFDKTAP